jgi:excisionase family DNA binding protein
MESTTASRPDGEDWLSVAETAGQLGLSQMTLYRAMKAGEFPALLVGRRLLVPARVLDEMAAAVAAKGGIVNAAEWCVAVMRSGDSPEPTRRRRKQIHRPAPPRRQPDRGRLSNYPARSSGDDKHG